MGCIRVCRINSAENSYTTLSVHIIIPYNFKKVKYFYGCFILLLFFYASIPIFIIPTAYFFVKHTIPLPQFHIPPKQKSEKTLTILPDLFFCLILILSLSEQL